MKRGVVNRLGLVDQKPRSLPCPPSGCSHRQFGGTERRYRNLCGGLLGSMANQKPRELRGFLAEGEGFEPPRDRRPLTAFKAAAFNRSATPPGAGQEASRESGPRL